MGVYDTDVKQKTHVQGKYRTACDQSGEEKGGGGEQGIPWGIIRIGNHS
jgi:hypothetical protein